MDLDRVSGLISWFQANISSIDMDREIYMELSDVRIFSDERTTSCDSDMQRRERSVGCDNLAYGTKLAHIIRIQTCIGASCEHSTQDPAGVRVLHKRPRERGKVWRLEIDDEMYHPLAVIIRLTGMSKVLCTNCTVKILLCPLRSSLKQDIVHIRAVPTVSSSSSMVRPLLVGLLMYRVQLGVV